MFKNWASLALITVLADKICCLKAKSSSKRKQFLCLENFVHLPPFHLDVWTPWSLDFSVFFPDLLNLTIKAPLFPPTAQEMGWEEPTSLPYHFHKVIYDANLINQEHILGLNWNVVFDTQGYVDHALSDLVSCTFFRSPMSMSNNGRKSSLTSSPKALFEKRIAV